MYLNTNAIGIEQQQSKFNCDTPNYRNISKRSVKSHKRSTHYGVSIKSNLGDDDKYIDYISDQRLCLTNKYHV